MAVTIRDFDAFTPVAVSSRSSAMSARDLETLGSSIADNAEKSEYFYAFKKPLSQELASANPRTSDKYKRDVDNPVSQVVGAISKVADAIPLVGPILSKVLGILKSGINFFSRRSARQKDKNVCGFGDSMHFGTKSAPKSLAVIVTSLQEPPLDPALAEKNSESLIEIVRSGSFAKQIRENLPNPESSERLSLQDPEVLEAAIVVLKKSGIVPESASVERLIGAATRSTSPEMPPVATSKESTTRAPSGAMPIGVAGKPITATQIAPREIDHSI